MTHPFIPTIPVNSPEPVPFSWLRLICPTCGNILDDRSNRLLSCTHCHRTLKFEDGIYKALRFEREIYFQDFVSDYSAIRQAEGRGSVSENYYLALPFRDLSGRLEHQWKMRAKSFRVLERRVVRRIAREKGTGIDLLDIGAGNGWLSYQLATRGHRPVAVDLLIDERDGLGAASHFFKRLGWSFPRFQAEMDCLPFADAQFDLVVFNAALHYSTHPYTTLREALRCLHPNGHLLVVDSPIYHDEQSGLLMKEDRHQQFLRDYGFRSDSIPSIEFLTYEMIRELGGQLSIDWKTIRPWYGIRWALRPLQAKWSGKREPSKFHLLWGRKKRP